MHQLRMAISTFVRDVARGVLTLTHSGLAMLGLVLVLVLGGQFFAPICSLKPKPRSMRFCVSVN